MPGPRRYKAFISYSHDDERWARWLQRALEGYRLPNRLRKRHPKLPARLFPIFRDRDELASGHDLSESIQQAIADFYRLSLRAQAALWQGDVRTALASSTSARALIAKAVSEGTPSPILALSTAQVELTLGASQRAAGNPAAARQTWTAALKGLGPEADDDLQMLAVRRLLAIELAQPGVAARISARLAQAGFADPRFQPEVVGSEQPQKGAVR